MGQQSSKQITKQSKSHKIDENNLQNEQKQTTKVNMLKQFQIRIEYWMRNILENISSEKK